jgi:hypothetical protein
MVHIEMIEQLSFRWVSIEGSHSRVLMESRLGSSKMLQQGRREDYSCTGLTNKRQIVFVIFSQLQAWRIQRERRDIPRQYCTLRLYTTLAEIRDDNNMLLHTRASLKS